MVRPRSSRLRRTVFPAVCRFRLAALAALATAAVVPPVSCSAAPATRAAFMTPANRWADYPTRLVSDLPGYRPTATPPLSQYGGWRSEPRRPSGFFRTEKIGDRWWLIDPDGCRFIHVGVVAVTFPKNNATVRAKHLTPAQWAEQTTDLLHATGFNGTGAWSDTALLRAAPHPVVYTVILNFMAAYGRQRGGVYQQPGHLGYPHDAIFVFDPQFAAFCDQYARQVAATRDDPWLLGYFSDNELPFHRRTLDDFLSLPTGDPGRGAAEAWLGRWRAAHPGEAALGDDARDEFVGYVADRYLALTTAAIRKVDPHHLCLGPRFTGQALASRALFRACGRHLDVIAVNYYHAWSPNPALMRQWEEESGRPFLITEWYAKGMDSGFANTSGAGWVVQTQADRGRFYQNFALGLLESRGCVGWHWFKYLDNDPADRAADPSNRDSNKGIVNLALEPYRPLTDAMRGLNTQVYPLIDYFEHVPAAAK